MEKRYRFSRSTKKRVVFLFTVLISDNPAHWYRLINIQRIYHYGTLRLTANCCLSNMNVYIKMPWYLKRHDFLCIYVAKEMQNQINMPIKFFWPLLCPQNYLFTCCLSAITIFNDVSCLLRNISQWTLLEFLSNI